MKGFYNQLNFAIGSGRRSGTPGYALDRAAIVKIEKRGNGFETEGGVVGGGVRSNSTMYRARQCGGAVLPNIK